MRGKFHLRIGAGILLASVAGVIAVVSCGTAPTPFVIQGPGSLGNDPPSLSFITPTTGFTRGQGDPFLIEWTDTDNDDNALVSFSLVALQSGLSDVLLVAGIEENRVIGVDSFVVNTTFIAPGIYNLVGTIQDGVNAPVNVFAPENDTFSRDLVVTIVGPGEGPQTVPPTVVVTAPAFNLSVAQDDILTIVIQPTEVAGAQTPFDVDSTLTMFVLLDVDQDPTNDDPRNPSFSTVIQLRPPLTVGAGATGLDPIPIQIDLGQIPPRPAGEPYFIRVTVDDGTNPPVHSYAPGSISVVQLAAGTVDLFDIGRTKSGARFQGFNPKANLGSSISTVSDFDADGVEDFVMVAQFGNPQNVGPVGEAYLLYGQAGIRFGGTISVNAVSNTLSGVIFQAPPVRSSILFAQNPRTNGITDASFIPDMNGDGRPELVFGLSHVHGAWDSMDYDPGDDDPDDDFNPFFCYPDFLVNNVTTEGELDVGFYAGGMAVIVNSTNRDNDGRIVVEGEPDRLDTTAIGLEFAGQRGLILSAFGESNTGNIIVRADTENTDNIGNDVQEEGRIAGARFIAGGYDYVVFPSEGPREGLFGKTIRALGDLNADGFSEIIVSAPRNERYLRDLQNDIGFFSTQLQSSVYLGSLVVFPGTNYNDPFWRDKSDEDGTSTIPTLDQSRFPAFGSCTTNPPEPRGLALPGEAFDIFAEDIDDMLGGGQSAGDFNQDGIDDILCGAPMNDRTGALVDSGAAYVIYGRTTFGEIKLSNADNSTLRPPMLRIRGLKRGDQIGWSLSSGLDVNGDRLDDIFIGSPRADFGGVTRVCPVEVGDRPLSEFESCVTTDSSEQLFSNDVCSLFDFDNDLDVDEDDRCIFCCLSGECTAASDCTFGRGGDCCADTVDNGFVGIVFGGVFIDGDRSIDQLATTQLPGVIFFGTNAGDRAGTDVSSAGDFNQDGFGDILIAAPGETRVDTSGRIRQGVVYLVFGGTHLTQSGSPGQTNGRWDLSDVGSDELPGIVFLSPYVQGRPNEAAPTTVSFIGDINFDGFDDIAIGNPLADFIDPSFPQGPDAPGSDSATGRRSDVGDVYVIYGNNFGTNRTGP